MSNPVDEQRKYPTVAVVLASRGEDRITMHANVLRDVADIAEEIGGCAEGVTWGRTHSIDDVSEHFRSGWGTWIVRHFGEFMEPDVRSPFLQAAIRGNPVRAALFWEQKDDLTDDEYAELEQCMMTAPNIARRLLTPHERADRKAGRK